MQPVRADDAMKRTIATHHAALRDVFGACIKLRGATGAPMRPVAMPLRS